MVVPLVAIGVVAVLVVLLALRIYLDRRAAKTKHMVKLHDRGSTQMAMRSLFEQESATTAAPSGGGGAAAEEQQEENV